MSRSTRFRYSVSIPNGKPGPLRPFDQAAKPLIWRSVSIPNGKPGPLRPQNTPPGQTPQSGFQSQTGSQALSDISTTSVSHVARSSFNPKREARPSQTQCQAHSIAVGGEFQSQTGSQALSDGVFLFGYIGFQMVSIPNGKPGPLRPDVAPSLDDRRLRFQSQTGSQALSDEGCMAPGYLDALVSIPNGKPGPLRRRHHWRSGLHPLLFQSQTGSQALSDEGGKRAVKQGKVFQSQTGSQALSDNAHTLS